jgi:hypothetical protein
VVRHLRVVKSPLALADKLRAERDAQPRLSCARCGFTPPDGSAPQVAGKWTDHDPTDICLPCWNVERIAALPTMAAPSENFARMMAARIAPHREPRA